MHRLYLDTNIFVALVEAEEKFHAPLQLLERRLCEGGLVLCTSELSWCEALVKPLRMNDPSLRTCLKSPSWTFQTQRLQGQSPFGVAKPSAFSKLRLSAAAIPGRKSLSKVGHVSHNPLFKQALTERYDRIFNQLENLSLVPVHREVLWQAAKLRAGQNLKTPDAIHLATALLTGCKALLSQDLGMPLLTNMPLWRLESLEDNLSLI